MKNITMIILTLAACSSEPRRPNLVVDFVHAALPAATCEAYYTDEGEARVHSARCKLPTPDGGSYVAYCWLSLASEPKCTEPPKPRAPGEQKP